MRPLSLLLHLPLALAYGVTLYADHNIEYPQELRRVRGPDPYGRLKYLTIWNLIMQFAFSLLSTVSSLSSSTLSRRLRSTLDFLFISVVFSASTFVCTSFWVLYGIDRELIFPAIFDAFFPDWLNHAMHTLPIVAVTLELLTRKHQLPCKKIGFATAMLFMITYIGWVHYIAYATGLWVYPVLEKLPDLARLAFIVLMALFFGAYYIAGLYLHAARWGSSQEIIIPVHNKKKRK